MCSLINKQLLLTAYAYLFITEQQKGLQGSEALQIESQQEALQREQTNLFTLLKQRLQRSAVAVLTLGDLDDARAQGIETLRIDNFLTQRTREIEQTPDCLEATFLKELAELDKEHTKAREGADSKKISKLAGIVAPREKLFPAPGGYLGISAQTANMQIYAQGAARDSRILRGLIKDVKDLQTKVRCA